jgi:hypothetical protein
VGPFVALADGHVRADRPGTGLRTVIVALGPTGTARRAPAAGEDPGPGGPHLRVVPTPR